MVVIDSNSHHFKPAAPHHYPFPRKNTPNLTEPIPALPHESTTYNQPLAR